MLHKKNLVDAAITARKFGTLTRLFTQARMIGTLATATSSTLFAPTDEAFARLPADVLDALVADKAALKGLLLYHLAQGELRAADLLKMRDGARIRTASGKDITLRVTGGKVRLDGATVIRTDIEGGNGVIHAIDAVLLPPGLRSGATD